MLQAMLALLKNWHLYPFYLLKLPQKGLNLTAVS